MIGHDLLRYNLKGKKLIVWDFENAEGLNLFFSRPHELGYVIYNGKEFVSEYQTYIKWPNYKPVKRAAEVTGYKQEVIDKEGKDPTEVLSKFADLVFDPSYINIGSNILGYDTMILHNSMKSCGIKSDYSFINRSYDTNALFKGMKLGIKPNNENLLQYQLSMNSVVRKGLKSNVKYMCNEFGITVDETRLHQGLYDSYRTFDIFLELIKRMDVK